MHDPSIYTDAFDREHGCTEVEWLRWLPGAVGAHRLQRHSADRAQVDIGDGVLQLRWQVLPPRRIALISMPRLRVNYRFERVDAAQRTRFMQQFDLFMQRGGG